MSTSKTTQSISHFASLVKNKSAVFPQYSPPLPTLLSRVSVVNYPGAVAVFGANGFVGSHLVALLLAHSPNRKIYAVDVAKAPRGVNYERLWKHAHGSKVDYIQADVTDKTKITNLLAGKGIEAVHHTASIIRYMDSFEYEYKKSHDVNVVGTKNLLEASVEAGVKYFVYTSSYSVHCNGKPITDGDESMPVVMDQKLNWYYKTKALADTMVLEWNGKGNMLTASIRPAGIYGYGDGMAMDSILKGDGVMGGYQDFVTAENVGLAHVLAEDGLRNSPSEVAGQGFLISQGKPIDMLDLQKLVHMAGAPINPDKTVPKFLLYTFCVFGTLARYVSAALYPILKFPIFGSPSFSLAMYDVSTTYGTVDISKARRILGYNPDDDVVEKTIALAVALDKERRAKHVELERRKIE